MWLKHIQIQSWVGGRTVTDKMLIYFPLPHPGHRGHQA